ncbi:hypothetical protein [Paenirhodobacter populi]|uniref:hypothetical protein n=1 Tax=Paenirhodobacter populi TaxID=2306993 RepID=UPI0013E2CFF5|nr:hypothetical protein [Sinirhodobacter populi]
MHVKNAVLTFVAMGGFAVPVLFQSQPTGGGVPANPAVQSTDTSTPDDRKSTDKA